MDDKKIKKKKLTISITNKKPKENVNFQKDKGKTSVVVEKKFYRTKFNRSYNFQNNQTKSKNYSPPTKTGENKNNLSKNRFQNKSFELRKIAEQKATRRAKKNYIEKDDSRQKSPDKSTNFKQRREYKLTLSRALSDDDPGFKERSLASVRRARNKEKNDLQKNKDISENKKIVRDINIPDIITIQELANRMAEQASNIIKHLLGMGVVVTINHTIDADTAEYLVKEFGHNAIREQAPEVNFKKLKEKDPNLLTQRPPIVTVMGHVDHGKTSLLDSLRKTNVVSEEHGGITQHIGAYQIVLQNDKSVTFIDTPGHAAFTEMRARGSKITDIVVLVVAADDGVKPQTVEAINHAKAAKVPIIVAINKCDLPGADPQNVKNQLLKYELVPEELSGDTLYVEVSAATKKNLDKLVESIILQSEFLDLKANPNEKAAGVVIESSIDKGRGPVATLIIAGGTLEKGNYFVCGNTWGKVKALVDYNGNNIERAGPSVPVEILGINSCAISGDDFVVVESESKAKEINNYRKEKIKSNKTSIVFATQESAFDNSIKTKELPIIIKSDVHGSSEALKNAINNIKNEEVKPKLLLSDVGMITETDVSLAKASKAVLIGFNIKPSKEAKKLSESYGVDIKCFNIIYEALDFINSALSGLLKPDISEEVIGSAEILEIFKVSKVGKVAGSKVTEGEIINNSNARLIRDGSVLYTGSIKSIFREKNEAKQVVAGLECGITLKDFTDYKQKDIIEVYKVTEKERRI